MSPRGKAIPQLRERLILAGERVLVAGGPGAVTARAVAREAGVATGLLYHHFGNFDDFLAELVIDRLRAQAARMDGFPQRAGGSGGRPLNGPRPTSRFPGVGVRAAAAMK